MSIFPELMLNMFRHKKHKIAISALISFISMVAYAQEKLDFNIVSFGIDQFSTTAQDKRFEKTDDDGYRYAIIKVKDVDGEGNLDGFTFNFGALNSIVESHDDELWVYVQRNAKTVTIKRPGYKSIEKYDLNTTIQPGKTYEMRITMSRVRKVVEHDITKQVLQFIVTPSNENAIVKLKKANSSGDYELWGAVDETGSIDKILDFGTYDYVVSAQNYESSMGRVTLSNSKTTFVEKVSLKANFGFVVVDDDYGISGAQVFIDDIKVGTIPYRDKNRRLNCGTHKITVTNGDLYKPYNSTFTIQQGETTRLSPKLESDFAQTTINVDADAEIFIDGKSKGKRTWTGPLKAGKYVVECKQDKHKKTSISINVKADKSETFEVPAPVAITGSLYVRSNPSGAAINIDGEYKGNTPSLVHDVLIGEHEVTLKLRNYKTGRYKVNVKEGETENIDGTLSDFAQMSIDSNPSDAQLFINNEDVGKTPYSSNMPSGDYDIEIRHSKYQTFKRKIHLDSSNPTITIDLNRQYMTKSSFYILPTFQVGSSTAVGGAIGGYICNVNVEGYYLVSSDKSEEIWWNSTSSSTSERPFSYTYKPTYFGGKVGYGIVVGSRIRITPQLGMGAVSIDGTGKKGDSKGYASLFTIGCKLDYAFASCLSINITPEYAMEASKSDNFKQLSELSSKIKGWADGFNCRIGLSLFF